MSSNVCVQTIRILDTTPPSITCPEDVTIECGAPLPTTMATATDDCNTVTITFADSDTTGTCPRVIIRTHTATDLCGNSSQCTQRITLDDNTPPEIVCPADVTLECNIDEIPTTLAMATDDCHDVEVTYVDEIYEQECDNDVFVDGVDQVLTLIVRRHYATDECGNVATCTQHIVIRDDTPPTVVCPPNITIECDEDPNNLDLTGVPTVTDLCDPDPQASILITFPVHTSQCSTVLERIWFATDHCGNGNSSGLCSQFITIVDTEAPMIACPADVTVECGDSTDPENTGALGEDETPRLYGAAFNGPDGLAQLYEINPVTGVATPIGTGIGYERVSGMAVHPETGIIYAAGERPGDGEGEGGGIGGGGDVAVLLIIDPVTGVGTEVAELNGGLGHAFGNQYSDLSFRGSDNTLFAYLEGGDGLGIIDIMNGDLTQLGPTNTGSCCGNGMSFVGNDLYHFSEGPWNTLNQVTGQSTELGSIDFDGLPNFPRVNGADVQPGTGTMFVSLRTNDGLNYFGTIDVSTGEVSVISPMVNGMDALAWGFGSFVTDNCDEAPEITYADNFEPGCGLSGVIIRTWTATDQCGNASDCTQRIYVVDNTAPEISCPADVTIECGDDLPTTLATATEVCDNDVSLT
jgi:hypothetical protein